MGSVSKKVLPGQSNAVQRATMRAKATHNTLRRYVVQKRRTFGATRKYTSAIGANSNCMYSSRVALKVCQKRTSDEDSIQRNSRSFEHTTPQHMPTTFHSREWKEKRLEKQKQSKVNGFFFIYPLLAACKATAPLAPPLTTNRPSAVSAAHKVAPLWASTKVCSNLNGGAATTLIFFSRFSSCAPEIFELLCTVEAHNRSVGTLCRMVFHLLLDLKLFVFVFIKLF